MKRTKLTAWNGAGLESLLRLRPQNVRATDADHSTLNVALVDECQCMYDPSEITSINALTQVSLSSIKMVRSPCSCLRCSCLPALRCETHLRECMWVFRSHANTSDRCRQRPFPRIDSFALNCQRQLRKPRAARGFFAVLHIRHGCPPPLGIRAPTAAARCFGFPNSSDGEFSIVSRSVMIALLDQQPCQDRRGCFVVLMRLH